MDFSSVFTQHSQNDAMILIKYMVTEGMMLTDKRRQKETRERKRKKCIKMIECVDLAPFPLRTKLLSEENQQTTNRPCILSCCAKTEKKPTILNWLNEKPIRTEASGY